MLTPSEILAGIGAAQKIVPVIENLVKEVGPTIAVAGADAGQIVADASKLLADLKDKLTTLKAVAKASDAPPPPPAA